MVCIALLPAAAKVKTQPSKHPEGIAFFNTAAIFL